MEEDKPIHIIKLNTENNKYELSANLEQILLNDDVKDCEIAVISIAEQESNSCLLNFFLCYLYAEDEQKRNGKWIENADTQLTGIKWGLNSDRKFDGIWIWSKIFTKILPNDQKIGIMLMYTQSSFKGDDFSIAFTISALLSSTQIFNVSALMFDYYLHHFDALIRYGSIAGKNSPLQKLMFIVRNWFPVELNGGQRYLQFHSKSLEGVNKCFETIDCFAIPYLTNNFNEELEFKSRLLELIPLIFAPQAKRIQGVSIRVADLLEYFQLYFDLLKDRQFPPAEKVFAETCNLVAYKVAMEYYEGEMKRIFACGTVLTEAQFESTHITVKNYAINCMLTFFAELSESYRSDYVNKLHLSLENKLKFDWKQYVEKKQKDAKKTEAVAKNQNSDIIIAIDFGTTYTRVAVFENGNVKIIENEDGHRATPSYVAFTDEGRLFGDAAENEVVLNPNQTIFQIKRMLGSRFENSNVAHDIQHWPFNVSHENGKLQVKYKKEQKSFSPEQICAMILLKMKEMAENYTGKKVTEAVITVPPCFRNSQRQAILDAARIADLTVRILDETIAAAIAYGFDTKFKNKENVLIFDLGGGTLNVSIVSIENGNFEVKSTDGDPHLGGMDFINLLVKHFIEEFERKYSIIIENDKRAVQRLRKECEKAITTLSVARQSCIGIYPLCNGIDFCSSITQTKFEELSKNLIMRIEKVVNLVLQNANMVNSEIDEILLVGGSSRIPKIQQLLQVIFNGKELKKTVNPDEAIVYGAAIITAQLKGNLSQQFVALVQYHNLEVRILPCSDTYLMIKKNSPIPITINKEIRTLNENIGTQVDIIEDGIVIGTTHIDSGIRSISVTFNINLNGILEVTVLNKKLLLKRNVTDEEIQQISIDIGKYCKEDQDRKDKILAKNNLESACFKLQLLTNTNISKKDRILINERCDGIFSWLKKNELENIKEYERIRKAVERMYSRLAR